MSRPSSFDPLHTMRATTIDGSSILVNRAAPLYGMESPPQTTNMFDHKGLPPLVSYMDSNSSIKENETEGAQHSQQLSKRRGIDSVEGRRQRNREHQARHNLKQKNKLTDLENTIGDLKEEIQDLELRRRVLSVCVPRHHTRWSVAAEYFRLFRNGINAPQPMHAEMVVPVESHVQRHFLQTAMASDVVGVIGYGVEALLQNWKLISLCHPDIDIKLVRLENGPGDSVVATTRGTHTITENTLHCAFPHLVDGSEAFVGLTSRLLGQKLVMNGCTHLIWDNEARRVVSIQYTADLLAPMLQLLGNLEDVVKVFTNARLNPECRFVVS